MPLGKSGKHYYSPHEMKRQGDGPDDPAPAPKAAPTADPAADPNAGDPTVTLTMHGDGTVTCDDGSGQPSTHQSLDEALQYVKSTAGGGEQDPDASMSPMTPPASGGGDEDMAGMYAGK